WLLPLFSSQPCSPRDLPSCPTRRSSDLGPPSKGNAMQQPSDARRLIPALPAALAFTLGLAGCTTDRLSEPGQTADEQLLISTAKIGRHTSELQSLAYLVCRLLLEKKKKT